MIKAKFKNIGPIKDAELELGDLTIIAGQNNTGKTYLAYTLYGFLDFWVNEGFQFFYGPKYPQKFYEKIKKIARQIEKTGTASIDLAEYKSICDWLIRTSSKLFSKEIIHEVFSSPKEIFQDAYFRCNLEEANLLTEGIVNIRNAKDEKTSIRYFPQDGHLKFEIDNPELATFPAFVKRPHIFFERVVRNNYPSTFILSAERFGISLFYKELDFTKNRLVEELQNLSDDKRFDPFRFLEKQSARYAKPIKDNIDFARDLFDIYKLKSKITTDKKWHSIGRMMGGYYKAKKDEIKFVSRRYKENRFVIPLHLASSSVRGFLYLYLYLKHLAEPGQLLIIDEPESHLSPANQILIARLLAFCVNEGLKVLITTHSDYIIKEINNLIMLHSDFEKKETFLKKHKKNYTENDYLDPNSVRAYICENGGLTRCPTDKKGIDGMTVFDGAIDGINQVSAELDLYTDVDDSHD